MTPNLIRLRPPAPRSPLSAGWRAAARTSPAPGRRFPRRAPPAGPRGRSPLPRSRAPAEPAPPPDPGDRGCPPWDGSVRARGSCRAAALEPRLERLARDPPVRLHVARAGAVHHLRRQRRRRRRLVPAGLRRPVAHVLLVEARLRAPGLVAGGGPETGGVGREHLVAEHDR